ncbi:hypothetical protein [Polyangium spumosum]|uniref:Uncharacterized protein n=1 Tax=Polyangium spumosum TaxID=889282 RepID=A0A6N7Q4U7_9BACT|nr:hypothetical protein [Polyangium spumosum]MRG97910.1 hypothetical protein [Polyangium spumosum]
MKTHLALFVFVSGLAGCGSVVDTGGSTSTAASSGSGGDGGIGGGSSGAGGFGAGPSAPCVPAEGPEGPPSPLCGPGATPCQVLHDELLPVPPAFRNDAPALSLGASCQPQILFSSAENGQYNGFYAARKAPGDWQVSPTPFAMATAGLVSVGAGLPVALVNDGAFGASLWSFTAEGWVLVADVPAAGTHLARGFALGKHGELFAGFRGPGDELLFGRYGSSWNVEALGGTPSPFAVAVSPEGVPHMVAWEAKSGAWALHWHAPPLPDEILLPLEGSLLADLQRPALAVTAADEVNPEGRPHVLHLTPVPPEIPGPELELSYATRTGEHHWTQWPIEPVEPGTTVIPLGIVTDGAASVRLFYARSKFDAPSAGQLVVASRDPSFGLSQAVVAEGFSPIGATFERDGAGRIHVALYEFHATSDIGVRYLVLGP